MATISLRIVIALLISFATIISILIAFVPTYLSGVAAVRSTLSDLRGAYVGRAGEGIDAFFQTPIASLAEVHNAISHDMLNLTDEPAWVKWMSNYTGHYPDKVNVVTKRIWVRSGEAYATYSSMDLRYGSDLAIYIRNNLTHFTTYRYDTSKLEIQFALRDVLYPDDALTQPEYATRANPTGTVFWSHLYAGVETPSLAAILVLPDELNPGAARGYISAEVLPTNLDTFFGTLQLRGGARAVVVDSATTVMLGNSWGEKSSDILPGSDDYFAAGYLRMKMKTLTNLSDAIVLATVGEIGADLILTGEAPYATELYAGQDLTYVNVLEVTGPNLKLRLLLVMPEIDFMEEVYQTQTLTIVSVVLVTVVMIVGAILVAHLLTRPLVDLKERMELTASLKDTEADEGSLSGFTEVANMQAAYRRMKTELNRMKSYLPQSVLFPNDGDDDDDDEMTEMGQSGSDAAGLGQSHTALENSQRTSGALASIGSSSYNPSSRSDTASQSQRSRSRRDSIHTGVVVSTGLNTRGNVQSKRVSVIVFNIRSFHDVVKSSAASMTKLQTSYLEVIQRVTQENKGVIDVFQGDHVTCSFNAVGNCPASIRRSALVALQVVETLKDCQVTAGVANGGALVGNMGTDQMKRFCIVGAVVPQAMALERLTKWYKAGNVRILLSQSMLDDIQHELSFAVVDRIQMVGHSTPQLVAALIEKKAAAAENEWMYQLDDNAGDPCQLLNDAWGSIATAAGSLAVTAKLAAVDHELEPKSEEVKTGKLQKKEPAPTTRDLISASVQTLSALVSNHQEKDGFGEMCSSLAEYYKQCVASS